MTGLILPLAFRLYEFGFLVVLMLTGRAWWRWWQFTRPATVWQTVGAEVTETAQRGELAAVFRDRNGRRGVIALRALLPTAARAGLKAGDTLSLVYSLGDRSLAYVPAGRGWRRRRLTVQAWALTAAGLAMGVGMSLVDQIATPG